MADGFLKYEARSAHIPGGRAHFPARDNGKSQAFSDVGGQSLEP